MAGQFRVVLAAAILLLNAMLCLAQTPPLADSMTANVTVNGTVNDLDIICTTGSFFMDPHTAKRLSSMFCDRLLANFPRLMGGNYSMPGYPCDLPLLPGSANYSVMEESGLIAEFEFIRGSGIEINKTIITQGTKEQCFRDNCLKLLESTVDRCQWNSHDYGGFNTVITDCGMYTSFVQNCTNNLVDWNCRRWHKHYQSNFTGFPTSPATPPATFSIFTTIGTNFTSRFVMTIVTESGTTKYLPLTPTTVAPGSVTLVPFTPAPATDKLASSSKAKGG